MYPLEVCTRFYLIAQPQTFTWIERVERFETEEYIYNYIIDETVQERVPASPIAHQTIGIA